MPTNKSAKAALANVAPGSKDLTIIIKGRAVETGQYVPKADTQLVPELSIPHGHDKTFIAVMLDLEAPFPSFSFLSPILHWTQAGLRRSGDKLVSDQPVVCDYIGAGPPPGSSPHQYAVFLYEQPAAFDASKFTPPKGQKTGVAKRMRFDLDAFEREAGLGEIVACNYFKSN